MTKPTTPTATTAPVDKLLYTPVEAAHALGVSRSTVYELLAKGVLPSVARLGHRSPRAALIYQHATEERDRAVAEYMEGQVAQVQREPSAPIIDIGHRQLSS